MTGAASLVKGKRFTSGGQLEDYTKQLMQEVGSAADLKAANPTAFRFMWDLFQRHSRPQEKKLESVRRVAIGPSEQDGRLAMWLVYADGSPLAISANSGVLFFEVKPSPGGTSRNGRLAPPSVPKVDWPCFRRCCAVACCYGGHSEIHESALEPHERPGQGQLA